MEACIEASICKWVIDFVIPTLDMSSNKDMHNFYISWTKANLTIISSIKLQLSESLKAKYQSKDVAKDLIKALKDEYSTPRISSTFTLFKELLSTHIAWSSYPVPSLNKVITLFSHLDAAGYKFPANIQAMLLLAKLPPSMDVIMQMIAQAKCYNPFFSLHAMSLSLLFPMNITFTLLLTVSSECLPPKHSFLITCCAWLCFSLFYCLVSSHECCLLPVFTQSYSFLKLALPGLCAALLHYIN